MLNMLLVAFMDWNDTEIKGIDISSRWLWEFFSICFKELHNKDLQTLKKSHQEQTRTAENMMQNLVSNVCFCYFTISASASF